MAVSHIFSLQGHRVMLTGATGHLGKEIAMGLGKAGAELILIARNEQQGEDLVDDLAKSGIRADFIACNLANETSIDCIGEMVQNQAIHGLVNNAYSGGGGSVETSDSDQWRAAYEISVVAAQRLVKLLLPNLRQAVCQTANASIVNIGSMYGSVSPDLRIYKDKFSSNPPYYGAAKAALGQFTRYAACELGSEAIRVNQISPGPFPSPAVQNHLPHFIQKLRGKCPLGRIGEPNEIVGPVVFLLSPASSFITGSNLAVDGGWTAW